LAATAAPISLIIAAAPSPISITIIRRPLAVAQESVVHEVTAVSAIYLIVIHSTVFIAITI
jgi:hypothetical protein